VKNRFQSLTYKCNLQRYTTEGHWRFQVGDDEAPGGFCDLLREKATDPELAIKEWKALKGRLEPLYDALDACPLTSLRWGLYRTVVERL
jgi:hypothetical protein